MAPLQSIACAEKRGTGTRMTYDHVAQLELHRSSHLCFFKYIVWLVVVSVCHEVTVLHRVDTGQVLLMKSYRQTHTRPPRHHSESESVSLSCIVPSVLNETFENAHKALK